MTVVYEDNHIIVVNKTASEIVQADKTGDTPLSETVKQYLKEKYQKPGNVFIGVTHRLDRPVSGLVIFAKTSKALTRLNEMFRAGVIATLQPHFDVVGQAADVEGSVAMIAQTKPDVVLLDVHVPGGEGGGGTEILAKSRLYSPDTVFLALSVSDSPQDVGSVIRAGAQGYVTKTISGSDLISSIKQVHEGYAVFSPKLAGFVLSAFQNGSSTTQSTMMSWTGCRTASRRS